MYEKYTDKGTANRWGSDIVQLEELNVLASEPIARMVSAQRIFKLSGHRSYFFTTLILSYKN